MTHFDSNLWESPVSQSAIGNQITIGTNFDSSLPKNMRAIYPRKEERQKRYDFTLRERKRAEQAKIPSNMKDMENLVSNSFCLSSLLI